MPKITRDTIIAEVLRIDVGLAKYLLEIGMHCLGCPASQNETVAEACAVHGVDPEELLERMNSHLEAAQYE